PHFPSSRSRAGEIPSPPVLAPRPPTRWTAALILFPSRSETGDPIDTTALIRSVLVQDLAPGLQRSRRFADISRVSCPACGHALSTRTAGDVTVDVCDGGCGGIWFDHWELQKLDEQSEAAGESLLDVRRDPGVVVD